MRPEPESERSLPQVILLVLGTILLLALGYAVSPVLSPFVLVGSLIYVLYPLREHPLPLRIIWLSVFLFVLWFLHSIIGILAPFIVDFLGAYILNPLVTMLERRRIPRWISSLMAVLLVVGIGVSSVFFILPAAAKEFQGIIAGTSLIVKDLTRLMESGIVFDVLSSYGIPVEQARDMIGQELTPKLEGLLTALFQGLLNLVTGVSSLAMHIINIVIIPFLIFYLLMDYPQILERFYRLVPSRAKESVMKVTRITDEVLGSYLRGAIIVAFIQGSIAATGLWLLGVKYSLVLGIMTGLLNFIPYVGLMTSLVISSIVAMFSGGPIVLKVVGVVFLYLSQKLLEATVLGPKIIGSRVGLHPVLLILCLLVFGHFLGLVGMLIAVPATALINVAMQEWETSKAGSSPPVTQPVR